MLQWKGHCLLIEVTPEYNTVPGTQRVSCACKLKRLLGVFLPPLLFWPLPASRVITNTLGTLVPFLWRWVTRPISCHSDRHLLLFSRQPGPCVHHTSGRVCKLTEMSLHRLHFVLLNHAPVTSQIYPQRWRLLTSFSNTFQMLPLVSLPSNLDRGRGGYSINALCSETRCIQ